MPFGIRRTTDDDRARRANKKAAKKEPNKVFPPIEADALISANGIGSRVTVYPDKARFEVINRKTNTLKTTDVPIASMTKLHYKGTGNLPGALTVNYHVDGVTKTAGIAIAPVLLGGLKSSAAVNEVRHKLDQMMASRYGTPSAPSAPAPISALDELAKLATLRDQGIVTEQEFQEQKSKLLGTQTADQSQQRFDPQTGRRL